MKLNIGQVLVLQSQIIQALVANGVIDAQGNFVDDLQAEIKALTDIETLLKSNGLVIPDKVDKIIQLLPLILTLVR